MTDNDPHSTNGLLPGVLSGLVAGAYGAFLGFSGYGLGYATVCAVVLAGLAMIAVRSTSRTPPPPAALFSLAGAVLGQIAGDTVRWARASGVDYGTAVGEVLGLFPCSSRSSPPGSCSG
jgi:hypothetical protein